MPSDPAEIATRLEVIRTLAGIAEKQIGSAFHQAAHDALAQFKADYAHIFEQHPPVLPVLDGSLP